MATYYVSTKGSDSANGSSKAPWKTIGKAMKADLKPGDTVIVKSGTYKEAVVVNDDGKAGQYITIRSETPGGAKIDPPGNEPGIKITASYVKVDGFDVSGSKGSGITGNKVHHVEVTDNVVHNNESNGIFFGKSDYLLIEGNTVHDNAAKGGSSGIHLKAAYNITGSGSKDGYRIIVRDNASYDNTRKYGPTTDGNGISLDDFQNTQISGLPEYKFKTLVEGNVTYSNYGRGIQVAWSDNATIRDNVAYENNAQSGLWKGELQNMGSSDNKWIDNIAVADTNNPAIANVSFKGDPSNKNVSWSDNTTFNGKKGDPSVFTNANNSAPSAKTNDLGQDPKLSLSDVKAMGKALGNGKGGGTSGSASSGGEADDAGGSGGGSGGGGGGKKGGGDVRIQAEDYTSAKKYKVEKKKAADEGKLAWIQKNNGEGELIFNLKNKVDKGTYDLTIGHFDEADGEGRIDVKIVSGGKTTFKGGWNLTNDKGSSNSANAQSFREKTFKNVEVGKDAKLVVTGEADRGEHARLDYFDFG